MTDLARHDVMSVPGSAEDGSDTAWFVVDRQIWPQVPGELIGDGEAARLRAFAIARSRNVASPLVSDFFRTHDYWTTLSALGRAAIDYAAEVVRSADAPGSDAVVAGLQDLAHLAISFAMQGAIDLGHDAAKIRELERELIADLAGASRETS